MSFGVKKSVPGVRQKSFFCARLATADFPLSEFTVFLEFASSGCLGLSWVLNSKASGRDGNALLAKFQYFGLQFNF